MKYEIGIISSIKKLKFKICFLVMKSDEVICTIFREMRCRFGTLSIGIAEIGFQIWTPVLELGNIQNLVNLAVLFLSKKNQLAFFLVTLYNK